MKSVSLVIQNEAGLHSRPADLFVRTARLYKSEIVVHNGLGTADAKNIIKIILLNVSRGEEIRIVARGPDEDQAIEDLKTLVESGFSVVNERVTVDK